MVNTSVGFDVNIVSESVIKDRPVWEIAVNPINDVADELPYELLVSEVFVIPVGIKELEVSIVDDEILQNSQLYMLQKHLTVLVLVLVHSSQLV